MDDRASNVRIVGVGASAGGIESLKEFFDKMPAHTGMSFVVIQHLDPNQPSYMTALLSKCTAMKVAQAEDGAAVHANQVYTIPPNKFLFTKEGKLHLTETVSRDGIRMPIDFFFRSLAEDQRENAIAVLFSGSGSDGTLGIREIHGASGFVIVQDPKTAQFDSMIEHALATGMVDYALPVRQIPGAILEFVRHDRAAESDRLNSEATQDGITSILHLLARQTKNDFRCYKSTTIHRRIERRMGLNQINDITEYYHFLSEHPDELAKLAKDMLIGVTSFFRDPEAFEELRDKVIAPTELMNLLPLDVGRPVSDISNKFPDTDLVAIANGVLKTLIPVEKEVLTSDGLWHILRCLPYRTSNDVIDGVVFTFTDVTPLKHSEEAMMQANRALLEDMEERKKLEEQLRQAQKMESMGTLATGIAHDLNNILNIIQGYTSILGPDANGDQIGQSVEAITETTKRGAALVQQLLTLSRKTETKLEPIDANTIIQEVSHLLKETFPKNIEMALDLAPRLPLIMADSNQITQVLLNLCVNARDAMPDGGRLVIETGVVDGKELEEYGDPKAEEYVSIEVTDTGKGMDENIQSRVFEPFFTTKEIGQGTGLGLAVVYGIVKSHSGFIQLKSKPMHGTTFLLYLPVVSSGE